MTSVLDVELTRSRLTATINEMTHLLYRSAYSTLMRESRDCSFLLLAPSGDVVVSGPGIFHLANYYYFTHALLERFPDMRDGDVYLSNHPYEGGIPHTPDLAVAVPVFVDGVHVGFSCSLAHKPDFGGSIIGSASMESTELYQEGLLLPPMLAIRDGIANEVVTQVISANVRNPDLFFGDMRAQIGVTQLGAERLKGIAARTGAKTMLAVYSALLDQGERHVRERIAAWPDGTYSAEVFMDDDGVRKGVPVGLRMTATVQGDSMTIDCTASDDQTVGPANLTRPYSDTDIFYVLVAMTDPEFGYNDGMRRAVEIVRRSGSVLDPIAPAPVGAATSMHHRFTDLCCQVFGHFARERAIAHSGGSGGTLALAWRDTRSGARALQYEVLGTAMGGLRAADGASGVTVYCTGLTITPIEVIEAQFPVRFERFELIADSGGPGKHRGGLSYRREYRALAPASVIRRAERGRVPSSGVESGGNGSLGAVSITRSNGTTERLPVAGRYELFPGDLLCIEGSGAGGLGNPMERDVEAVCADVRRGHVTVASARADYGVVIDHEGNVDEQATRALRHDSLAGTKA